jgi:hypothetical protein
MAFKMVDDVLAPKGALVYEYYGKDPFSLYFGIGSVLQSIFHLRGKDIFEDQFRWDITADPRPFFFIVRANKGMDRFTEGNVQIKVFGAQPTDPSKDGKLMVEISSWIETQFFGSGPLTGLQRLFVQPFVWIYNHVLYYKTRRNYIHFFQEGIEQLEEHIKTKLGIEMHERMTPRKTELV